jgi:hypothetical protein
MLLLLAEQELCVVPAHYVEHAVKLRTRHACAQRSLLSQTESSQCVVKTKKVE